MGRGAAAGAGAAAAAAVVAALALSIARPAAAQQDLSPPSLYMTSSFGVPVSWARVTTQAPEASLDRFGLGDLYFLPAKLGVRTTRLDVVASYALYSPTGRFALGGTRNLGRGYWTQQPAVGGTLHFDDQRGWSLSALASADANSRMRQLDITRGTTVLVQGGAGARVRSDTSGRPRTPRGPSREKRGPRYLQMRPDSSAS